MAVEAPFHVQGHGAPRERHFVNGSVASRAAHTLADMDAVVEISEIREAIDPVPLNGTSVAIAFSHRFEHGTSCPDLRVTVHAGGCRWHARKRAHFHRRMTITAIDAEACDVVFVAEGYGLLPGNVGLRYVRRSLNDE